MTLDDRTWMLNGKCLNLHPDTMFPESDEALAAAKRICRDCPVIARCRAWARGHYVGEGSVWAGVLRTTRQKDRDYSACGTVLGFGRHERWGEKACDPCREAESVRRAELRAASVEHEKERKRTNYANRKNKRKGAA